MAHPLNVTPSSTHNSKNLTSTYQLTMWCEDGITCGGCGCEEPATVEVTQTTSKKKGLFNLRKSKSNSVVSPDNRNDDGTTSKKGKIFGMFGSRKSKSSQAVLADQNENEGMSAEKKRRWFSKKKETKLSDDSPDVEEDDDAKSVKSAKSTSSSRSFLSTKLLKSFGDNEQRRVVYRSFGSNAKDLLGVEIEEEMPQPEAPDHVVIKVQASTVGMEDCILRRGFCDDITTPVSLPVTPGSDVVGNIVVCGNEVADFKKGERVAALVRTGGNARFISVPAKSLVVVPKSLDAAEAVTMVSTFAAAYQSLKLVSENNTVFSMQGKKVLVIGGMQSVGQALIQLCSKARAEIFATAPETRHDYVRNVLEATPLPENSKAWSMMVEGEMDYVFDGVCEDGLETASSALTPSGKLVCFGQSSVLQEEVGMFGTPFSTRYNKLRSSMISGGRTLDLWSSFKSDPNAYKKNLQALFQLLKWQKIKPNIAKRVALSEVAAVHARLDSGDVRGTVVCYPWKRSTNKGTKKTANGDDAQRE